MSDLTLSPQVFAILSALIEDKVGLSYSLSDKALLESKVSARAMELGFESALDYYYYLRYDDATGAELDAFAELLVVHETYFFREFDQLQPTLARVVLPLIAAGRRPRIWSAACSTGEEPSTIAIWLADRGLLDKVDLVATDLSNAALRIAKAGRYRPRSLRQIPSDVAPERWIEREGDTLQLNPKISAAVQWRQLNLLDAQAVRGMGEFDLILCRNLLIYFRDDVTLRVVDELTDRLRAEGTLLVGVSESLMRFGTRLVCEERDGVFFYRKAS